MTFFLPPDLPAALSPLVASNNPATSSALNGSKKTEQTASENNSGYNKNETKK